MTQNISDDVKEYLRQCALVAGADPSDMQTLEQYLAEGEEDAARGLIWSLQGD